MPIDVLTEVCISIGSNLGSRLENLNAAVEELGKLSRMHLRCSAVYETAPVGLLNQPKYLNMVVSLCVMESPRELLTQLAAIEARCGRERTIRFGPRTLDLDILLYGNRYVCFRDLQVPHPRMWERAFVLVPLSELEPGRRALGGRTVSQLAKTLANKGDVQYVGRFW